MPHHSGLMAGSSNDPVFIYEDGADPARPPSEIISGGVRRPAPAGELEGNGDDLLYRVIPNEGGAPGPGTVHSVQREVRPDRETGREPWLTYHAVFDPALVPFKRNSAKDRVKADGGLIVGDPALTELLVTGNRTEPGREVFWGSILVELDSGIPVPIPSVSPESRVLSYTAVPDVTLRFFRDGADNYYVDGAKKGRVRVNFVMDAPSTWFHAVPPTGLTTDDVPVDLRPTIPPGFAARIHRVSTAIGVLPADDYAKILQRLVFYFRSFAPGELSPDQGNDYVDLALARKGVCRHRAYAFVITAHGLGIPARYVSNEAHVFVEVYVPRVGWVRVDLGGGAQGMNVRNSSQKTRHTQDEPDPFGFPSGFRSGYSHRALSETADGAASESGGDPVRGLPPALADGARSRRFGPTGAASRSARSPFGVPRAVPFAADDKRKTTRTLLDRVSARVFRGDKVEMTGRVLEGEEPVVGGQVRINLMDPEKSEILDVLGHATTGPTGHFVASVTMPMNVQLGTWEVVAEFIGTAKHAPSHSE